jgi:hypothetical protein
MTSDRAYTGKPFVGALADEENPDPRSATRIGHRLLTEQDQRELELFAHTYQLLTADGDAFWQPLRAHVLRIGDERTGRIPSVGELGVRVTGYKSGSDNATAAGLGYLKACLHRYRQCRAAAQQNINRSRRQRRMQAELEQYATGERKKLGRG